MKCSLCGSEEAYQPLLGRLECPNLDCDNFSWDQCKAAAKERELKKPKLSKSKTLPKDEGEFTFNWTAPAPADKPSDETSEEVLKRLTYSSPSKP